MHAKIQCPNCEKATLAVELSGPNGNEYSTQCPICGPISGVVFFEAETLASAGTVSV
jgi:uncharacterized Zn finger protein